ncbi:hypothetical protein FDP41_012961 [Naegleria fowleri]|uniref:F-box domain-containing protein n=2 Tax=Naegleria fowleri TaxID=5763 RepID=A0A6A5BSW6_NAEFO|nr:uncharacterized protein FDP41_012961 [Naegleria fowleri]KAF0981173.1 hypothetical protein FDP41_012961 [Naegleria fowleri]CAG4712933.1 unnamed protein product [Naegleria fowleri]
MSTAQHLPHDILFHIFTNYSTPDQYMNALMLVCKHWNELTHYEMFWVATLKQSLRSQIQYSSNVEIHEMENLWNDTSSTSPGMITMKDIQKERERFIKSMETRENILIINLLPFTKRKETNDDIFGNVYKQRTVQFLQERSKRRVALELLKMIISVQKLSPFINPEEIFDAHFEKVWEKDVIQFIENHPIYDRDQICSISILNPSETVCHLFVKSCRLYLRSWNFLEKRVKFVGKMLEYLFVKGVNSLVSPLMDALFALGHPEIFIEKEDEFSENGELCYCPGLFKKFESEFKSSSKGGVSKIMFRSLVQNTNFSRAASGHVVSKFVRLILSKKLTKFKESMVEPYLQDAHFVSCLAKPNFELLQTLYLDIGIHQLKNFNESEFVGSLLQNAIRDYPYAELPSFLRKCKEQLGMNFSHPNALYAAVSRSYDSLDVLKFLVEECHVDVNADLSPHAGALPLVIFNSISGTKVDTILYLVEKGATVSENNMGTYEGLSTDQLLSNFISNMEYFISTCKLLIEKFNLKPDVFAFLYNLGYSDTVTGYTVDSIFEILDFCAQHGSLLTTNMEDATNALQYVFNHWSDASFVAQDQKLLKHEFAARILEKYDITLEEATNENEFI